MGDGYPVFTFPEQYPLSNPYDGGTVFKKHYYRQIAAMNGEEAECARVLDQHPEVTHWLRNLEKQPRSAFWLSTTTDKFYPDFVTQLSDGRVLVPEYKGEYFKNTPDTLEKTAVGRAWAKASGNVFLMAFKKMVVDTSALMAVLQDEPQAHACMAAIERAHALWISAGTVAEALENRHESVCYPLC